MDIVCYSSDAVATLMTVILFIGFVLVLWAGETSVLS